MAQPTGHCDWELSGKFNIKNTVMKGDKREIGFDADEEEDETFKFSSATHKSRASQWLKNLSIDDGQFCNAYDENNKLRLFVCGNIREFQGNNQYANSGYNEMRIDLVDIDEEFRLTTKVGQGLIK